MGFFSALKSIFSGAPAADYSTLIANGAIVVDVRTKDEYRSGHAKNSQNIPLHSLKSKLSGLKGKTVILVCRSGARAGQALILLKSNDIEAYNAGAWQNI